MIAFAILLVVHGLIHLLGTAKAFGWVELPQLAHANAVGLVGVAFGFLSQGPFSLRAEYDRDVERRVSAPATATAITDADLVHLPEPVQRYLRMVGVVGQPRIHNFQIRMHGRIRSGRDGRWMPLSAEQHNVIDPPARLFHMRASMLGIQAQGYHRYVEQSATMRVKAAALVPVVTAEGQEMTRGETVTLFDDMCVMAPATLIDPAIVWEEIDPHAVQARVATAGHTVSAELSFNDAGELAHFVSDDRSRVLPDGPSDRSDGRRRSRDMEPTAHSTCHQRARLGGTNRAAPMPTSS